MKWSMPVTQGGSRSGTLPSTMASDDRQGWGQVMRLSGVSSPSHSSPPATAEHLSRSNSEGWELLHHDECGFASALPFASCIIISVSFEVLAIHMFSCPRLRCASRISVVM